MSGAPTVRGLFQDLRERLGLEWVAGRRGQNRAIEPAEGEASNTSLVGHLNLIHPHRVQVMGPTEDRYLRNLRKNTRLDTINQLFSGLSDLVVVGGDLEPIDQLKQRAESNAIPLLRSPRPTQELVNNIHYYLSNLLAERITLHGVLMEVLGVGVLIMGDASVGKSELALELVARGHRLVADDAPEFARIAPDMLRGRCPRMLQDFLEVRGLGILNIRAMFGDSAIKQTRNLRLIIRLQDMDEQLMAQMDRLRGSRATRTILGVELPEVTLPVAPGRNLAVLVETAVRNHILQLKGYDASDVFIQRQSLHLKESER